MCRGFLPPTSFNALLSTSFFNLAPKSSFPFPVFPLGIPRGRICSRSCRINPLRAGLWTKRLHKLRESLDRDIGFKAFPGSLGHREGLLRRRVFPCGFQHTHNFLGTRPQGPAGAGNCFDCNRLRFRAARNYLFSFSFPPHPPHSQPGLRSSVRPGAPGHLG